MQILPKSGLLLVSKNQNTEIDSDMYIPQTDDNKKLITCNIIEGTETYPKDTVVITGVYSLYQLVYKGEDYFFLDQDDVIGTIQNV